MPTDRPSVRPSGDAGGRLKCSEQGELWHIMMRYCPSMPFCATQIFVFLCLWRPGRRKRWESWSTAASWISIVATRIFLVRCWRVCLKHACKVWWWQFTSSGRSMSMQIHLHHEYGLPQSASEIRSAIVAQLRPWYEHQLIVYAWGACTKRASATSLGPVTEEKQKQRTCWGWYVLVMNFISGECVGPSGIDFLTHSL